MYIELSQSKYFRLKKTKSLDNEILDFLNNKKVFADINFAEDIIKISNKVINQ